MPVMEMSAARLFERKSAYLIDARAAQMYSSNRERRSSSLPRKLQHNSQDLDIDDALDILWSLPFRLISASARIVVYSTDLPMYMSPPRFARHHPSISDPQL